MKKLCILLSLLTLLLCSCLPQDLFLPDAQVTTVETTSDLTIPGVTTPEMTTPEVTTPQELPHEHIFELEVFIEPTCVQPGLKRETCVCGARRETNFDVTGEHSYQAPVVTKAPTCTEAGESTATCSGCPATQKAVIHATGYGWCRQAWRRRNRGSPLQHQGSDGHEGQHRTLPG